MIVAARALVIVVLWSTFWTTAVFAQDDVITRARAAASAGRRAEGIALLEQHLATSPRDVDARLVYGLILSWDGQYDRARTALLDVLAQAPDYLDARVALMNVEWWSGRSKEAREQVNAVLAKDTGNAQARLVQQRLDARTRPWEVSTGATYDTFSDDRDPWQELFVSLRRDTPIGAMIVRGNEATRFGTDDRQLDFEFYPVFRAGTYAFVGGSVGDTEDLYPKSRVSFDLYQSLGRGFELSGGYRQLNFDETTRIYLSTLTKYLGNWMLTGKVYRVPDETAGDSWTYHAVARRYFGASGQSFGGVGYSRGFSREEPRGAGDLVGVNADTVRGQLEVDMFGDRVRLELAASTTRRERASLDALWQTTTSAGLSYRF